MMPDNVILQHWREPFHKENRHQADLYGDAASQACGDIIMLYLYIRDGRIYDAYFDGEGCVICLGMASIFTQSLIGKSFDELRAITPENVLALASDVTIDRRRHECALVAFKALRTAVAMQS